MRNHIPCLHACLQICMAVVWFVAMCASAISQTISGVVVDENGNSLFGANVVLRGTTLGASVGPDGSYEISNVQNGEYAIVAGFIGYKQVEQTVAVNGNSVTVDFTLETDVLEMESILVSGTFNKGSKLESSVAITTLNQKTIEERAPRSPGDLLTAVPGTFVDASAGEGNARVFPRGLASGTFDRTGWRYVSLQEDGLPVMSTLVGFMITDMFFRPDITVGRLEAIRGGSSSITASNSPGGLFNFISREGGPRFTGEARVQGGMQGENNALYRTDFNMGGPLNKAKDLSFDLGGFFRKDNGFRNSSNPGNRGGQVKLNLVKHFNRGFVKLYSKYLNDRLRLYSNIPIKSFTNPKSWGPFDINYSSTILDMRLNVPDSKNFRNDSTATRSIDTHDGIRNKSTAFGLNASIELGKGWLLSNNLRFSFLDQHVIDSRGENIASSTGSGGNNTFRDINGNLVARYQGGQLVEGEGFDYLYLTALLDFNNSMDDIMNQLKFSKNISDHQLTLGSYFSRGELNSLWLTHIAVGMLEPNPRLLQVTIQPGRAPLSWSNADGLTGVNSRSYVNFNAKNTLFSFFVNDVWRASSRLNLDLGLRYEMMNHEGSKERWKSPGVGGLDGNRRTLYDGATRLGTGDFFDYNYNYNYLSGSLGMNLKTSERTAFYGRVTRGVKAPDVDYYISNFVNRPISEKGKKETITQVEGGLKFSSNTLSMFVTGFYSRLADTPFREPIFDVASGLSIDPPFTFNTERTIGTEIETVIQPVSNLNVKVIATVQDAEFVKFTYRNRGANTTDIKDDFFEDFSGNKIDEVPSLQFDITPSYKFGPVTVELNARYTGERYYNKRNAFKVPGFTEVNSNLRVDFRSNLSLTVHMRNIFNSAGITSFGALGVASANVRELVTKDAYDAHVAKGLPVWGRPILPRSITTSLSYAF